VADIQYDEIGKIDQELLSRRRYYSSAELWDMRFLIARIYDHSSSAMCIRLVLRDIPTAFDL
jgi:hypothetical protein